MSKQPVPVENTQPSISRRRVLGAAVAGAGTLLLEESPAASQQEVVYDCVVLGAGISGLTTARNLKRDGCKNVLVLEGSKRIGGRMFSQYDFVQGDFDPKHYPIEAGSEFVHVGDKPRYKEFWDEIKRHKFKIARFPKYGELRGLTWVQGANRITFRGWNRPRTLIQGITSDPDLMLTAPIVSEVNDFLGDDMPVGKFVNLHEFEGRGPAMASYSLAGHTPGYLFDKDMPGRAISVAGYRYDSLLDQLASEQAEHSLEVIDSEGARRIAGFAALPCAIAAEFQKLQGTIETERVVTSITKVRKDQIEIWHEGPGGPRRTLARAVVCTFSVGKLEQQKKLGGGLFGEFLTKKKQNALEVVRMGGITKFTMQFQECVWGGRAAMTILSNPEGPVRTFFSCFPGHEDGPFVLTAFLIGPDHDWIRKYPNDQEAADEVLKVLQSIYEPNAPEGKWVARKEKLLVGTRENGKFIANVRRQDWEADEFARGGYSYLAYKPGASLHGAREALKNPLDTLPLFWAGEATAPAYNKRYQPLSVHGAFISGLEVATDVLAYLRSPDGFSEYYTTRYPDAGLDPDKPTVDVTVPLTSNEYRAVRKYAAQRVALLRRSGVEADLGETIRTLIRAGFNYMGEVRPPEGSRSPAEHMHVRLSEEEVHRAFEYSLFLNTDVGRALQELTRLGLLGRVNG